MREPQHEPERRCIITGERGPKSGLLRLALGSDGIVLPDVRARAPGRGAWLGVTRAELQDALEKGRLKAALARAFKTGKATAPEDLPARIEAALERHALDRLGLEARAGTVLTGSDRIEDAARAGKVRLLLHAEDAGADGNRKLDQAWRVGSDAEGSGRVGLVICAGRAMLSQALGRENVVHIAVTDRQAAERVGQAVDRWHHFKGRQTLDALAQSAHQGHGGSAQIMTEGPGLSE